MIKGLSEQQTSLIRMAMGCEYVLIQVPVWPAPGDTPDVVKAKKDQRWLFLRPVDDLVARGILAYHWPRDWELDVGQIDDRVALKMTKAGRSAFGASEA